MTSHRPLILALTVLLLMSAASGRAQTADPVPGTDPVDRLLNQPGDASEEVAPQDPAELRVTRALNEEIVARNQLAENEERADKEAWELEQARYQATYDQATRDRLAYEEAVRQADAARRQWEIQRDEAERARALACRREPCQPGG